MDDTTVGGGDPGNIVVVDANTVNEQRLGLEQTECVEQADRRCRTGRRCDRSRPKTIGEWSRAADDELALGLTLGDVHGDGQTLGAGVLAHSREE
jgi:hypothetical protein